MQGVLDKWGNWQHKTGETRRVSDRRAQVPPRKRAPESLAPRGAHTAPPHRDIPGAGFEPGERESTVTTGMWPGSRTAVCSQSACRW